MKQFENELNGLLVSTFNSILKFEDMSLRAMSNMLITMSEAHALEAAGTLGENATVTEIAVKLGVTLPTATVAIKKLERKGLVVKKQCSEDGRRTIISLTEAGARANRAHTLFHRRMVRDISGGFSDNEKQVLLESIQKLSKFFEEKVGAGV